MPGREGAVRGGDGRVPALLAGGLGLAVLAAAAGVVLLYLVLGALWRRLR